MNDRHMDKLRTAALAGAVILLGSGCSSAHGSTHTADASVRPTAPTTTSPSAADANSSPAEALCHALITDQDLPPGFGSTSTAAPCSDDSKLQATGFVGQHGGLEMINEELERTDSAENAASRLPQLVAELNLLAHNPSEQDPASSATSGTRPVTSHSTTSRPTGTPSTSGAGSSSCT